MTQRSRAAHAISTRFLRIKKPGTQSMPGIVYRDYDMEGLFHGLGVLVDAGIGTAVACFGTLAAVVVVMLFAFFGAQAAGLYARGEKVARVF